MATIFDLRFKKIHFNDRIDVARTIRFVVNSLRELSSQSKESNSEHAQVSTSGKFLNKK